jgi:hypothetical protein
MARIRTSTITLIDSSPVWVLRLKGKAKNGILPEDRLEKLESIVFVWKVHKVEQNKGTRKSQLIDDTWQIKYHAVVK